MTTPAQPPKLSPAQREIVQYMDRNGYTMTRIAHTWVLVKGELWHHINQQSAASLIRRKIAVPICRYEISAAGRAALAVAP